MSTLATIFGGRNVSAGSFGTAVFGALRYQVLENLNQLGMSVLMVGQSP